MVDDALFHKAKEKKRKMLKIVVGNKLWTEM
jgi:hypothetical protein